MGSDAADAMRAVTSENRIHSNGMQSQGRNEAVRMPNSATAKPVAWGSQNGNPKSIPILVIT